MVIFVASCLLVIDFGNYVVNFMAYSQLSASSYSTCTHSTCCTLKIFGNMLSSVNADFPRYDPPNNSVTTIFLAFPVF